MMALLEALVRRVGTKILGIVLAGLIALVAVVAWHEARGRWREEQERRVLVEELRMQAASLAEEGEAAARALGELREEFRKRQDEVETARRLLARLEEMRDWLDWLFLSTEDREKREAAEELARRKDGEASERLATLVGELGAAGTRALELEARQAEVAAELARAEAARSPLMGAVADAWLRIRWPLAFGAFLVLAGPTLWSLGVYYGLAPWLARGAGVCLAPEPAGPDPTVLDRGVSVAVPVRPGERLWIRPQFLQASDEGLCRRTRWLFDWRVPFTSLTARLYALVELAPVPAADALAPGAEVVPGGPPGADDPAGTATISAADDAHVEFLALDLPAGAALALRSTLLVAVGGRGREKLRITRHWVLGRRQGWLSGRLRHVVFHGPCVLVVHGGRGIRVEMIGDRAAAAPSDVRAGRPIRGARRVNADATIGFTPWLHYGSVPAETFWSYYWGTNPLLDDLFRGRGMLLCQETTRGGPAGKSRRFWAGLGDTFLRTLGW